jgi:hypothetical protein
MADLKETTYKKHIFTLQRTVYVFYFSWLFTIFILCLPILILDVINGRIFFLHEYRHIPYKYGENIYNANFIFIFVWFSYLIITRNLKTPWDPYFIISDTDIQYNTFAVPFKNILIDKLIWNRLPLSHVKEIQLHIRNEDKDKPGFRLNEKDKEVVDAFKKIPFRLFPYPDQGMYDRVSVLYKNQTLIIEDTSGKSFASINVTYAYEEELAKLQEFLDKKSITFTKQFVKMEDRVKKSVWLSW